MKDLETAKSELVEKDVDTSHMTPRQKKFYELKLKREKAHKMNMKAVKRELIDEDGEAEGLKRKRQYKEEALKKEMQEKELLGPEELKKKKERERLMNATAELCDEVNDKKHKREKRIEQSNTGWDRDDADVEHSLYMKRMEELPEVDQESYNAAKVHTNSDDILYRNADNLSWGQDSRPPEEAIDNLLKLKEKRSAKAKKFSRRRMHYEEAEITGISEANERYNRGIHKAYSKYTSEIKASLERGTAL
eukprot:TRINITY_DN19049_c0_g1_i1.p1 TRINITY_DN19049_c0_g1~~TRINITY_DN19049_c0_g1_i1.p1  ORF type:complete len:271 (-),score=104.70 TRINITY_DN19049_c0_g1_i1:45-791(-)